MTLKAIALLGLLVCCVLWGRTGKWYQIDDDISQRGYDPYERDMYHDTCEKVSKRASEMLFYTLIATAIEFLLIAHL